MQRKYLKPKPYATEVVRWNDWKMLANNGEPVELFDLSSDITEKKNMLGSYPDVVKKMKSSLHQWLAEPRLSPLKKK